MSNEKPPKIVAGFTQPSDAPLTENEWKWIEIVRIICNDKVPAPNLPITVTLRKFLG